MTNVKKPKKMTIDWCDDERAPYSALHPMYADDDEPINLGALCRDLSTDTSSYALFCSDDDTSFGEASDRPAVVCDDATQYDIIAADDDYDDADAAAIDDASLPLPQGNAQQAYI